MATPGSVSSQLKLQWSNPSDILSLLLLVGGDVIQKALAQSTGYRYSTVTFSFGWVAYSFNALLSAIGDGKLVPEPDCSAVVVNTRNNYTRTNRSWMLGRMVRDVDYWIHHDTRQGLAELLARARRRQEHVFPIEKTQKTQPFKPSSRVAMQGLCVTIYQARCGPVAHPVRNDALCVMGPLVSILQLGIAAIPCGLYLEWQTLVITACGTILAYVTGILPQWSNEKWACRILDIRHADKTVALTRGNGSQHVIIIIGAEGCPDLEDLATSEGSPDSLTEAWSLASLCLWIALLISVSGIKSNTWYLVAVGAIGIIQNIYVAGAKRSPEALGIHLEHIQSCVRHKVMGALMEAEIACQRYSTRRGIGKSLLDIYFPRDIWETERQWWALPSRTQEHLDQQGFWEGSKEDQARMIEESEVV